jgi:asparagine synthase (glutamine-hydrolysing)
LFWEFPIQSEILYRTDAEYEEHFLLVIKEAVRRRLRSDSPILAELSGGMDSSSVVCIADALIAAGAAETSRLDTVSYFDDSEPNWNERPYFTKVEEKRCCRGCHVDVSSQKFFSFKRGGFAATPGSAGHGSDATSQVAASVALNENRVLLSGIGGDEITGGVPTPLPELEDLLARGRLQILARQLKIWALNQRKPWFQLLCDAARGFLPQSLVGTSEGTKPVAWLDVNFLRRNREAIYGYSSRLKVSGPLPSLQRNLQKLDELRRQLACQNLSSNPMLEKRYPYLDRTFLEFMLAIPRSQLVRPGQRRSLMRRALEGIVPDEILQRKRKAFVSRRIAIELKDRWSDICDSNRGMVSEEVGVVDVPRFLTAVHDARDAKDVPIVTLLRTLQLESWLRGLRNSGLLCPPLQEPRGVLAERTLSRHAMGGCSPEHFRRKGGEKR